MPVWPSEDSQCLFWFIITAKQMTIILQSQRDFAQDWKFLLFLWSSLNNNYIFHCSYTMYLGKLTWTHLGVKASVTLLSLRDQWPWKRGHWWEFRNRRSKLDVSQGLRGGGNRENLVKGYSLSVTKWTGSKDLIDGIVTIVSHAELCTWNLLRK